MCVCITFINIRNIMFQLIKIRPNIAKHNKTDDCVVFCIMIQPLQFSCFTRLILHSKMFLVILSDLYITYE